MIAGVQIRQAETQTPTRAEHKALGTGLVEVRERVATDQTVSRIFITPSYHIRSAQRAFYEAILQSRDFVSTIITCSCCDPHHLPNQFLTNRSALTM
jgi:hypothetical protein